MVKRSASSAYASLMVSAQLKFSLEREGTSAKAAFLLSFLCLGVRPHENTSKNNKPKRTNQAGRLLCFQIGIISREDLTICGAILSRVERSRSDSSTKSICPVSR